MWTCRIVAINTHNRPHSLNVVLSTLRYSRSSTAFVTNACLWSVDFIHARERFNSLMTSSKTLLIEWLDLKDSPIQSNLCVVRVSIHAVSNIGDDRSCFRPQTCCKVLIDISFGSIRIRPPDVLNTQEKEQQHRGCFKSHMLIDEALACSILDRTKHRKHIWQISVK